MFSKQKPEGYVLFDKAIKIEYLENPDNPKAGTRPAGQWRLK